MKCEMYQALLHLKTKVTKVSRCRGHHTNHASHCPVVHLYNTCWSSYFMNFEGKFLPRAVSIPSSVAGAILWPQGYLVWHCPCSCKYLPLQNISDASTLCNESACSPKTDCSLAWSKTVPGLVLSVGQYR